MPCLSALSHTAFAFPGDVAGLPLSARGGRHRAAWSMHRDPTRHARIRLARHGTATTSVPGQVIAVSRQPQSPR
jgi:hypothetical protein